MPNFLHLPRESPPETALNRESCPAMPAKIISPQPPSANDISERHLRAAAMYTSLPCFHSDYTLTRITGAYRGNIRVLVVVKMALSDGVAMQLTVRSEDPNVSELVITSVA